MTRRSKVGILVPIGELFDNKSKKDKYDSLPSGMVYETRTSHDQNCLGDLNIIPMIKRSFNNTKPWVNTRFSL